MGVRFNPYLFPDGLDSPVGHALYKKAGCAPGLGGVGAAWEVSPGGDNYVRACGATGLRAIAPFGASDIITRRLGRCGA